MIAEGKKELLKSFEQVKLSLSACSNLLPRGSRSEAVTFSIATELPMEINVNRRTLFFMTSYLTGFASRKKLHNPGVESAVRIQNE